MEIAYPILIVISIPILIALILIKFKKANLYLQGKKVANTKYVEQTDYYKNLMRKYRFLVISVKSVCVICIVLSIILTARIIKIDKLEKELYNRDIILCMDASTSVDSLNAGLTESLKEIVKNLHGERFGISIFNTSSVVLSPLTDDYDYINNILDELNKSFNVSLGIGEFSSYYSQYTFSGTLVGNAERGSSIIGDGLASSVLNFPKLDEDRTRIIIFSTDNELAGKEIFTLSEAAKLAKKNNVIVFGIAPSTILPTDMLAMKLAVESTGGKYYTEGTDATVKDIVNEIEKTGKSLMKSKSESRIIDYPEVPFVLLVVSVVMLYILNKKVSL